MGRGSKINTDNSANLNYIVFNSFAGNGSNTSVMGTVLAGLLAVVAMIMMARASVSCPKLPPGAGPAMAAVITTSIPEPVYISNTYPTAANRQGEWEDTDEWQGQGMEYPGEFGDTERYIGGSSIGSEDDRNAGGDGDDSDDGNGNPLPSSTIVSYISRAFRSSAARPTRPVRRASSTFVAAGAFGGLSASDRKPVSRMRRFLLRPSRRLLW